METNKKTSRIVPLRGSVKITAGSILKMIYPNMTSSQLILIKIWLMLEKLQNFILWKR